MVVLRDVREGDARRALAALRAVAAESTDLRGFAESALDRLPQIIPSDLTTLSLCDLRDGTRHVFGRQAESLSDDDRAAFDRHFRTHPLVRFHGSRPDGPAQRISDCLDPGDFRNSALFSDYYRRIGIRYVMALPLRVDAGNLVSIVFNRSRSDFTDDERATIDAIRQPLAAFYRGLDIRSEALSGLRALTALAAASGWHVVRIGRGRLLDAAPEALRLLARYFGDGRQGPGGRTRLPAAIADWLARSRNLGLDRLGSRAGEPLTVIRPSGTLVVHFVAEPTESERGYLLLRERRRGVDAAALGGLPLTAREREILALVAAGRTNAEIGVLLGISSRTAQKHLEHVFAKLAVETRTAAAVMALAAASAPPAG